MEQTEQSGPRDDGEWCCTCGLWKTDKNGLERCPVSAVEMQRMGGKGLTHLWASGKFEKALHIWERTASIREEVASGDSEQQTQPEQSDTPQTYRKKPVEVRAIRLTNDESQALAVARWCGGHLVIDSNPDGSQPMHFVQIATLEGTMQAAPGDYVIRGVKGEFYPCKPDIFQATYERVG